MVAQAQTAYGDVIELGRGRAYLDAIPHSSPSTEASSRSVKSLDEDEQRAAQVEQVQGADMWVDILHQRSGRLIGRLLLHAGQLNVSTSREHY